MAKRRTRKQKERAKHNFSVSWQPGSKKESLEPDVKGQFKKPASSEPKKTTKSKKAKSMAKQAGLGSIRSDIVKSLSLAALVVGLEVVIYLVWRS